MHYISPISSPFSIPIPIIHPPSPPPPPPPSFLHSASSGFSPLQPAETFGEPITVPAEIHDFGIGGGGESPCRHPPAPPPSPVKPYWWDGEDDNDNDNNNNKKRGIHDDDNDEADEIPVFSRGIFVGKKSYRFFKYEIEASTVNLHIIHILIEIHIVLRVICHLSEVQSTNNLC